MVTCQELIGTNTGTTNKESTSPFTASEADHARLSLTAKQIDNMDTHKQNT